MIAYNDFKKLESTPPHKTIHYDEGQSVSYKVHNDPLEIPIDAINTMCLYEPVLEFSEATWTNIEEDQIY